MKKNYECPEFDKGAFTCPNCSAFSKHDWEKIYINVSEGCFQWNARIESSSKIVELKLCKCENCGYISFWYDKQLIWPLNTGIESPIDDMPMDIKNLYNEARNIFELSPKGACAILRLALQKLCNRLANQEETKKIDGAIKKLVENGLPETLQKAMDTVRIVGDEAVHPGEINIDDNKEIATALFRLMNIIVEKVIVEPNEIDELYKLMPDKKIKGIENRDKKEQK